MYSQNVSYSQPAAIYSQPAAVYSQPVAKASVTQQPQRVYSQPVAVSPPRARTQAVSQTVQRAVPVCSYDVRTVLVPKQVVEDYVVQETRMVAIQIPVAYQRSKWISVPREISIPRPMIEKRVITKTVPKVIQVEEQYEVEVGMTEMQAFFLGADADGSGTLSYGEWEQSNAATGYSAAQMRQMFVSRDTDGDGQLSMAEMSAAGTLPSAQMQGAMMGGSYATGFTTVTTATRGSTSPVAAGSPILNYVE